MNRLTQQMARQVRPKALEPRFGKKKTREGSWVTGLRLNGAFDATDP